MLNVHLEDTVLRELGVDSVEVDLEEETLQGGPYFLPMSQDCVNSLTMRSEVDIHFDDEFSESVWCFSDADQIQLEFRNQLYHSKDECGRKAIESTHWQHRGYALTSRVSPY